jgi:hypothetical protein
MLTRAIVLLALCLGLGAPAWGDSCPDLAKAKTGIPANWPDAVYVIYTGPDSDAIESGLRKIGGKVDEADRAFVVITRPSWKFVRIVGFVDGCYEDFLDVSRDRLDAWLAGLAG